MGLRRALAAMAPSERDFRAIRALSGRRESRPLRPMFSPMGVLGGCAAVALMWWAQAPLLTALERPPGRAAARPAAAPAGTCRWTRPAPPRADDGARWTLERVTVALDGEPLVEAAAPAPANAQPIWQGEVTPGPHTLLALFEFRREGAADDDPSARVQVERPQIFQARPGRPLALDFTPSEPTGRRPSARR